MNLQNSHAASENYEDNQLGDIPVRKYKVTKCSVLPYFKHDR